MASTFDAAARQRLVALMQIQQGFDPQVDDMETFDFEADEEAFGAVQREAIGWASCFDAVEVYGFLSHLHQSSADGWLAGQAFGVLAHLRPPGGLPFLTEILASDDVAWRCAACQKLAELPGEASSALLAQVLLSDDDPEVRFSAAQALRTVGTENAIPALMHAAVHDHGENYEGILVLNEARHALSAARVRRQDAAQRSDR